MISSKITSSLEKAFINDTLVKFPELKSISALKGERISFQLLCCDNPTEDDKKLAFVIHKVEISGKLKKYAKMRIVKPVAVQKPVSVDCDEHYLKTEPGIFPDVLMPMANENHFYASSGMMQSVWIDLDIPENAEEIGESELTLTVTNTRTSTLVSENKLTVKLIDEALPKAKLLCTQWLSYESIWKYYGIKPYGEKFFEILENTISIAAKNGMNVLFLGVFSGTVKITKSGEKYSFSYNRLDRLIKIAKKYGISRFEVDHLFKEGTAEKSKKVIMTLNGKETVAFDGTDATAPEYTAFLRAFLKSFIRHMKSIGEDKNLIFHIADEPSIEKIESFRKAKATVSDILDGYEIIDALFDIEYYNQGLVSAPVPITSRIAPFIEVGVENLWTYYCCGPQTKYSNRFIALPSAQNRSIGMQLFKFRLTGFLHWGLNYYLNAEATDDINPYFETSGENWVPAGDTFVVYPGADGKIHESLRLLVFADALQDIRAMELCSSLYSHGAVVSEIEKILGKELRFDTCAYDSDTMLKIREKINEMIERTIEK